MAKAEQQHKSKFIDFRSRRSVHVALRTDTHKELRKALMERDISMQEMFQRFSELVVSLDKKAIKILEDLERDKREGNLKRIQKPVIDNRGAKAIYDLIAEDSEIESKLNEEEDE